MIVLDYIASQQLYYQFWPTSFVLWSILSMLKKRKEK